MGRSVLVDAEEQQVAYPDTFELPSKASRLGLSIGDFAKLLFRNHRGQGERMWVEVFWLHRDGGYFGRLDNRPVRDHSTLAMNSTVTFSARHVIQIRQ